MILIDDTLLSTELFDRKFCCDLKACKGACCVEGESGAPLEPEELAEIEAAFPIIKDRLKPDSLAVIEREGLHVVDADGDHVTPIVNGKECVYATFDDDGTAKCAFEQAHLEGKLTWRKQTSKKHRKQIQPTWTRHYCHSVRGLAPACLRSLDNDRIPQVQAGSITITIITIIITIIILSS